MTLNEFISAIKNLPNDFEFVLSQVSTIIDKQEEEEYFLYHDIPIVGISVDEKTKEIRFLIDENNEDVLIDISNNLKKLILTKYIKI